MYACSYSSREGVAVCIERKDTFLEPAEFIQTGMFSYQSYKPKSFRCIHKHFWNFTIWGEHFLELFFSSIWGYIANKKSTTASKFLWFFWCIINHEHRRLFLLITLLTISTLKSTLLTKSSLLLVLALISTLPSVESSSPLSAPPTPAVTITPVALPISVPVSPTVLFMSIVMSVCISIAIFGVGFVAGLFLFNWCSFFL